MLTACKTDSDKNPSYMFFEAGRTFLHEGNPDEDDIRTLSAKDFPLPTVEKEEER